VAEAEEEGCGDIVWFTDNVRKTLPDMIGERLSDVVAVGLRDISGLLEGDMVAEPEEDTLADAIGL
jgi:hypothetical protein